MGLKALLANFIYVLLMLIYWMLASVFVNEKVALVLAVAGFVLSVFLWGWLANQLYGWK